MRYLTSLPNEIFDIILSYITDTPQLDCYSDNHISLVCKDFLNAHLYRIKYNKISLLLLDRYELGVIDFGNTKTLKTDKYDIRNKIRQYLTHAIKPNSMLLHVLFLYTKTIIVCDCNIHQILRDIKDTNITKLIINPTHNDTSNMNNFCCYCNDNFNNFINDKFNNCNDIIHIPNNITSLSISNSYKSLTFGTKSNINKFKTRYYKPKTDIKLPNSIEYVECKSNSDVNFTDCTFDNLKYLSIEPEEIRHVHDWETTALQKSSDYVKVIVDDKTVQPITKAKTVYIQIQHLSSVHSNVECLYVTCLSCSHDAKRYRDIIHRTLERCKNLRQLHIIAYDIFGITYTIKHDNITHFTYDASYCKTEPSLLILWSLKD